MKIPNIKELVIPENQAKFIYYEDGKLWYSVLYSTSERAKDENGDGYQVPAIFEFPVPIEDAAGARFLRSDSTRFFMRWMREHIDFLTKAKAAEGV